MYGSIDLTLSSSIPRRKHRYGYIVLSFFFFIVIFLFFYEYPFTSFKSKQEFSSLHGVESQYGSSSFFTPLPVRSFTPLMETASSSKIHVNTKIKYQTIFGFGGAFTEASCLHFQQLDILNQDRFMSLYFSKEGNHYTFGRIHMNSCDFCKTSYNFANVSGDLTLQHFDMKVLHDNITIIPTIQAALRKQPLLKLILSPWSPPAWMKTTFMNQNDMLMSATPNGLNVKYQQTWALYFTKFMDAYASYNITFWGLTVQNEPNFNAPWEACVYTAEYMATFVRDFLGPMLFQTYPNVKIMIYDHNKAGLVEFIKAFMAIPSAMQVRKYHTLIIWKS